MALSHTTNLRTVSDLDVTGKRVFLRVDFNVPLDHGSRITDDTRIRSALPTIQYLLNRGALVILASHLGRPNGKRDDALSLSPVAKRLTGLVGHHVGLAPDSIGEAVQDHVGRMASGDLLLLENLRFHSGEESNDPSFAAQLAALADVYVDDAFGAAHRAHASNVGITRFLPAAAGLLMQREVEVLAHALDHPCRPLTAIIGGAKISTKIGVLANLLDRADALLVGGAMANTFLAAKGLTTGASLVEFDQTHAATRLLAQAARSGNKLLLPVDVLIASELTGSAETRMVSVEEVPSNWIIVDIGPQTLEIYRRELTCSGTILWNGPMGVFEIPAFAHGTLSIAQALADSGATTIVGGGDSVAAIEAAGLSKYMTHVSTGGGASLEFLEGRELPGVAALRREPR